MSTRRLDHGIEGTGDETIRHAVVLALRTILDPEIPVNIVELGLIYALAVGDDADVVVRMTLTAPNCPVAESIVQNVEQKVAAAEGVRSTRVDLVFDPPWTPDRMSEGARLELGFTGCGCPAASGRS